MKKRWLLRRADGQSLVEITLTMPILILLFVGLIEVGAALRSYLVVVNANREGTRYAARGRWFGGDAEPTPDDADLIFERVVAAAGIEQQGGDLVQYLRPEPIGALPANTTIAVHYIEIPNQVDDTGGMRVEPATVNGPWYHGTGHVGETRIDAAALAEQKRQENYEFNQRYFYDRHELDIPSANNLVIVEVWYDHKQLLGLPIFTEFLPETFALYAQTTMRVTLDSRVE